MDILIPCPLGPIPWLSIYPICLMSGYPLVYWSLGTRAGYSSLYTHLVRSSSIVSLSSSPQHKNILCEHFIVTRVTCFLIWGFPYDLGEGRSYPMQKEISKSYSPIVFCCTWTLILDSRNFVLYNEETLDGSTWATSLEGNWYAFLHLSSRCLQFW